MRIKYIILPGMAIGIAFFIASCSKDSGSSGGYGNNPPPATPPAISIQLKTNSQFGSVLSDGNGKTLYFFSPDASGQSACTAGCLTVWPAFYSAKPTLGSGLDTADFKTITRTDGALQTTYKGWPLYSYAADAVAGDVKGDGIEKIWFVAKPDYTVMIAREQLVGNNGVQYDSNYAAGSGQTVYMTDDRGVTLYAFSIDKSGKNNYTAADFSNDDFWPIVQLSNVQNVPSVLDKTAFSSITVFGKTQLTYKGWPVYRFGPDALTRGSTKGVSVPSPGIWPVMNEFSAAAPQ